MHAPVRQTPGNSHLLSRAIACLVVPHSSTRPSGNTHLCSRAIP